MCGNKIDDNCNGLVDEGCDCGGVQEGTARACGQNGPGICTLGTQTCQATVWTPCTGVPAHASEDACDGKDENCNGLIDEGLTITCLHDIDMDGYPNPADKKDVCPDPTASGAPRYGCPLKYIRQTQSPGNDCNDTDPSIKPTAAQLCDNTDWDCDGKLRNGCPGSTPTFGTTTQSGLIGFSAVVSGCGASQVYASTGTSCPSGVVGLSGFSGGVQFSGPTQLSLTCNTATISETAAAPEFLYALAQNGANTSSTLTGPGRADDTAGSAICDFGQWVVGFQVTRSCLFDRTSIICAPITYQRTTGVWTARTGPTTIKDALGNPASTLSANTYQCPSGAVVSELTEWHTTGTATDSNYISGFKIGCRALGFTPQP